MQSDTNIKYKTTFLVAKDVDTIIASFLINKKTLYKLNTYFIIFSEKTKFCSTLHNRYIEIKYGLFANPLKYVKRGILQFYKKRLLAGEDFFLSKTRPKTRKKLYNMLTILGYKIVLENKEVTKSISVHRNGGNCFRYTDTTDMIGEIPRCTIKKRKADLWENWESTGKFAECKCPTFKAIHFMKGCTKDDGISQVCADFRAIKICSLPKEASCINTI